MTRDTPVSGLPPLAHLTLNTILASATCDPRPPHTHPMQPICTEPIRRGWMPRQRPTADRCGDVRESMGDSVEMEKILREQETSLTLGAAREAGDGEMPPGTLSVDGDTSCSFTLGFYGAVSRAHEPSARSIIYLLRAHPRSRLLSLYPYLSIPSILNSLARLLTTPLLQAQAQGARVAPTGAMKTSCPSTRMSREGVRVWCEGDAGRLRMYEKRRGASGYRVLLSRPCKGIARTIRAPSCPCPARAPPASPSGSSAPSPLEAGPGLADSHSPPRRHSARADLRPASSQRVYLGLAHLAHPRRGSRYVTLDAQGMWLASSLQAPFALPF
ncbi:hypothetical protein B0H14DRAFT_3489823 [Mycena olivaceomarginata]|nr:hypothetical protein B0H14DRAFT_3489823 [Mycena olivaceomarginata]